MGAPFAGQGLTSRGGRIDSSDPFSSIASKILVAFTGVDFMRIIRLLVANCCLFVAGGFGLVSMGCDGGSGKTELVKPAVPPQESGKDSMDYYKSQMKGGANKK
jgi:hypothetical protein